MRKNEERLGCRLCMVVRALWKNVLYAPGLQRNLVSLSKVGAAGLTSNFGQDRCVITSGDSQLVAARSDNGLYIVTSPASSTWVEANTALSERDLGL